MPANTAVFSLFSLAECRDLPQADLGRRVNKLVELDKKEFPLPKCDVIPVPFLKQLFTENKLEVRFRWLLEHLSWQDQQSLNTTSLELQTLIKQIRWPQAAQQSFLNAYQERMAKEYLAIRPSFVSDKTHGHFSVLHVHGESNVFESILELWASFYQPQELSQRWREWQQGIHIPAAIIIQEMIASKSSGFADIYFSKKMNQPLSAIYGVWGITTQQQRHKNVMDEFLINLKTEVLISQHINIKSHEYLHQLDQLDKKNVSYEQQAVPCLTMMEIKNLTQLLKKVYLTLGSSTDEILEVEWAYDGNRFFLLHIQSKPAPTSLPVKFPQNLPKVATQTSELSTERSKNIRIYLMSTAVAPTPPQHVKMVSGLGFQSDNWWINQSIHPKSLLENGQAHYLKHRMLQTLRTYFQHQHGKEFWFEPQSLPSNQLLLLDQSRDHEEKEANPWLGYRGGLRMVHQYDLFDFELDILSDFSKEIGQPIKLLLPWVRSSTELQLIYKHITHAPVEQYHHLQIWMECSTPENLLNIHQYAATAIAGVVINLDDVAALLFGLDPNNANVLKYYSTDLLLLQSLLKAVAKRLALFHKPMILRTKHANHQIISLLEEIGETGIMISNADLMSTVQFLQAS